MTLYTGRVCCVQIGEAVVTQLVEMNVVSVVWVWLSC